MTDATPSEALLDDIDRVAFDLAAAAGEDIAQALRGELRVRYKEGLPGRAGSAFRDPVSDVDERVEARIRAEVGRRFPGHAVVGEEGAPDGDDAFVWAIDPIDGTTNFVNGFPLFSASIGVLFRGRPVAGALWCSTSHALRAGVYHAREGGVLKFENEALQPAAPSDVRRRLAGVPTIADERAAAWDVRKTGSAAIECAFVAARLLNVARFEAPNVWDVAGGLALVRAAGGEIFERDGDRWRRFAGFGDDVAAISQWRRALAIGRAESVEGLISWTE